MSTRTIQFALGEYYHIYSRGVDKRPIFLENQDKRRFIRLMFLCNGSKPVIYKHTEDQLLKDILKDPNIVSIGAYCLMPNHFHILVKETTEGGAVKFMSKLLTAYSSYFNKKYERAGALFSSEFKATHIDSDEYLKYLFSYIHLNPMKIFDSDWKSKHINIESAKDFLSLYHFSSYIDYLGKDRDEKTILSKTEFPIYFERSVDFEDYIKDSFNFNKEE